MHAIDLADLANTFTRLAPAICALDGSLTSSLPNRTAVQDYWLTNRYRHEHWMRLLSEHRDAIQNAGTSFRSQRWDEIVPVIQEVLLSETLSRIVAYHAACLEELYILRQEQWPHNLRELLEQSREFASLTHSSLASHAEARNRCLHLMVFGPGLLVSDAVQLNRLRRIVEKYTDQLLSSMPPVRRPQDFCFDAAFVSHSQLQLGIAGRSSFAVALHTASLAESFWHSIHHQLAWRVPSARLNYRLSQNVLRLLPAGLFNGLGTPNSSHLGPFLANSSESSGGSHDVHLPLPPPLNILLNPTRPQSKSVVDCSRFPKPE